MRPKLLNFWLFNAVGWMIYSVSYFLVYYKGKWLDPKMILNASAVFIFGFVTCVVLRYLYRRIRFSSRSVISLALLIVAFSFLGAQVWLVLEILTNLALGAGTQIFQGIVKAYLGIVLFRGMLLMGWTVL